MKRILAVILFMFTLVACSNVHYSNKVAPINKAGKTVYVVSFPFEYEIPLEQTLEANGWTVYVVSNNEKLNSKKANFAIEYPYLNPSNGILGTVGVASDGAIGVSDLRTGQRFAVYQFKLSTRSKVINDLTEIMQSIPGAK